jgi:ABC-type uncharacterized transport system substrate-binding protein
VGVPGVTHFAPSVAPLAHTNPARISPAAQLTVSVPVTTRKVGGGPGIKAFVQALHELGWAHGRNIQIEYRWGGGNLDRIRTYAAELVGLKPDVVLAQTALAVAPLQRETRTVPIVFMQLDGFVASLARPGENLTGFTPFEFSTATKWLEILKEIAPGVSRVATVFNPAQSPLILDAKRARGEAGGGRARVQERSR